MFMKKDYEYKVEALSKRIFQLEVESVRIKNFLNQLGKHFKLEVVGELEKEYSVKDVLFEDEIKCCWKFKK